MSDAPAPTPKLCSICGVDCSGKQRAKDPNGRYLCMDCVGRAKEARAAQTAPKPAPASAKKEAAPSSAETDNSFLLDMGSVSSVKPDENAKPCPSCFKPVPEKALVCMNCGFNSKTGEQLKVRVLKAKEEPTGNADRAKGYSAIADVPDWAWVLGVLAISTGPIAVGLAMQSVPVAAIGLVGFLLCTLVLELWMLIHAFRTSVGTGLLYLGLTFVCFGYFFHWWYVLNNCENTGLKACWITNRITGTAVGLLQRFNPDMFAMLNA